MYTAEIESLIRAAQDARHCLASVNDTQLAGSIERTIAGIEQSIANVQRSYGLALPFISLPAMEWVKNVPRPTGSSKDVFTDMREYEAGTPEWMMY